MPPGPDTVLHTPYGVARRGGEEREFARGHLPRTDERSIFSSLLQVFE